MNIAIYNDGTDSPRQIESIIEKTIKEFDVVFDYRTFADEKSILNSEWHFDVAILDIEDIKSIELAKRLCDADSHLIIIIVSSNSEFLDASFELGAFRFLNKPLDKLRLVKALLLANRRLQNRSGSVIIKDGGTYARVYFDDIVFIEIRNRHTIITTVNSCLTSDCNMTYWRKLLSKHDFATPHNSFIVNLKHITLYKKRQCVVLNNSYIINISRTKSNAFDLRYISYLKTNNKIAN